MFIGLRDGVYDEDGPAETEVEVSTTKRLRRMSPQRSWITPPRGWSRGRLATSKFAPAADRATGSHRLPPLRSGTTC